jgi:hypothetical protein
MKTNQKKHEAKAKRLQQKMNVLQQQNPDIDFFDGHLLSVIDEHRKLVKELVYAMTDATGCEEQKFKCSNCICR